MYNTAQQQVDAFFFRFLFLFSLSIIYNILHNGLEGIKGFIRDAR